MEAVYETLMNMISIGIDEYVKHEGKNPKYLTFSTLVHKRLVEEMDLKLAEDKEIKKVLSLEWEIDPLLTGGQFVLSMNSLKEKVDDKK